MIISAGRYDLSVHLSETQPGCVKTSAPLPDPSVHVANKVCSSKDLYLKTTPNVPFRRKSNLNSTRPIAGVWHSVHSGREHSQHLSVASPGIGITVQSLCWQQVIGKGLLTYSLGKPGLLHAGGNFIGSPFGFKHAEDEPQYAFHSDSVTHKGII
jgi:hypothetical protein